jgi:hypothetical protein
MSEISAQAHDANMEKIAQGKAAALAETVVGDLVEDHVNMCLGHLVQMYRSGDINHDVMIGKVAEIAAMQGLISELETRQRLGHMAYTKEVGKNG